ncbi:ABC-type Co2+ transport system permease component-like protein [Alkaliphilus metalliredigens QYMF]|uniref:ABC-type Co2+ transport system permease component-like protein n=1 Tax=Alkaliphilus metalliredigens (strain QYMF) TaxID=293826 RepID=A6TNR0_ALKMQ|nr:energy-coupling factor ABC transporter permease [Alkaliphilus metalliredigens]ABR47828.1 ABC-type Co2+ transport system permease component-like protein [Alkaliphilus metalliredigens QYMF]
MSHIHVPDGIIPAIWWVSGYVGTCIVIYFIMKSLDKEEVRQKIPFTGIAAAIMLIGMSVPLVIVPLHLSLAVLTGILIGPKLGFLAVFVVNLILALFGHGGITIVGLNTLVIGSEVAIGFYLFRYLSNNYHKVTSTVIATVVALVVSMTLMVSFVAITADVTEALPHHHAEGVTQEVTYEDDSSTQYGEGLQQEIASMRYFMFSGWIAVLLILLGGIALEATGTALIVRYFLKVRPDLILSPAEKV